MKNIILAAYLILNLVFISNIGFFNFCNVVKASEMSSAEAKSNARALGGSLSSKVQGFASTSVESNEAMKKGLNYKGTDTATIPEQKLNSSNMEGEASTKKANSKQAELVEKGFYNREDHDLEALSKSLDKARAAQKDPEKHVNFLSGNRECKEMKKEDILSKAEYVCDEYADWKDNNCKVGQIVEVDAKHRYQCEIKREKKEGFCEKKLVAWCDGGVRNCGYNAGGIEEGSVDTGISWDYSYPYLRLGNKTPSSKEADSWHFNCGSNSCCDKKKSSARLKIKDIKNVKNFKIHKISYDDHAQIKINGVVVHNTLGGSYLEITNKYWGSDRKGDNDRIIASGANSGPCWRLFTNEGYNHYDYVGKDIKHYLREGVNEIEIELVYSQLGQVNVEFEAEQYCCTLKEKWEDECERLEP